VGGSKEQHKGWCSHTEPSFIIPALAYQSLYKASRTNHLADRNSKRRPTILLITPLTPPRISVPASKSPFTHRTSCRAQMDSIEHISLSRLNDGRAESTSAAWTDVCRSPITIARSSRREKQRANTLHCAVQSIPSTINSLAWHPINGLTGLLNKLIATLNGVHLLHPHPPSSILHQAGNPIIPITTSLASPPTTNAAPRTPSLTWRHTWRHKAKPHARNQHTSARAIGEHRSHRPTRRTRSAQRSTITPFPPVASSRTTAGCTPVRAPTPSTRFSSIHHPASMATSDDPGPGW
jgi:hypothetical protein